MKKIVLGLLVATSLLWGCKEDHNLVILHDKPIDTTHTVVNNTIHDSTYILSSVPAADPHNVLIEDFTGVTCSNCPAAHDDILVPLENGYPAGRVNIMEMFVTDFSQTSPNPGELYGGFRDSVATSIETNVFGALFFMPIAGIDRMPIGSYGYNNTQIAKTDWTLDGTNQLAMVDSINVNVSSTFDSTTRIATVIAKITYLLPTASLQNLSIAVVEDSFTDLQEFPTDVQEYHYNGVFRDLMTAVPFGDTLRPSLLPKEPGRVVQKVYSYYLRPAWVAKHCRVIAFVHGNGSAAGQGVYQSWQAPLAP